MKTVILDVRTPADSMADFVRVWNKGKPEKSARVSFATPELLWQVLTAKLFRERQTLPATLDKLVVSVFDAFWCFYFTIVEGTTFFIARLV